MKISEESARPYTQPTSGPSIAIDTSMPPPPAPVSDAYGTADNVARSTPDALVTLPASAANEPAAQPQTPKSSSGAGYPSQPSPDVGNYIGKMSADGNSFTTQDGLVFKRVGISKNFYLNGDQSTFAYAQRADGVICSTTGQYAGWAPIFVYRPDPGTYRTLNNGWVLYPDGRVTESSGKPVGTLTDGKLYGTDGALLPDAAQVAFAKTASESKTPVGVLPGTLSADGKTYTDFDGVAYQKDMTDGNDRFIGPDGTKIRMANGGTMFNETTYQVYGKVTQPGEAAPPTFAPGAYAAAAQAQATAPKPAAAPVAPAPKPTASAPAKPAADSKTTTSAFAGKYPAQPSPDVGNYIGKLSADGNTFTTQDGMVFKRAGISKHFYLNGDQSTFAYAQRADGVICSTTGQYAGWAPIFVYRPEPGTSRTLSNGWTLFPDGRVTSSNGKAVGTLTDGLLYGTDGKLKSDEAQAAFAQIAANSKAPVKTLPGKLSKDGATYEFDGVTYKKDMTNGNNVFVGPDGTKIRMGADGTMFSETTYQVYGKAKK